MIQNDDMMLDEDFDNGGEDIIARMVAQALNDIELDTASRIKLCERVGVELNCVELVELFKRGA